MPGANIFVADSGEERGICLLYERICICIIRPPLPCPEPLVFRFMVPRRLAPLHRYFVLVFQQKQYLLLLPSRQTVYCGYVFDQQHTEHLPLLGWKAHHDLGAQQKECIPKSSLETPESSFTVTMKSSVSTCFLSTPKNLRCVEWHREFSAARC